MFVRTDNGGFQPILWGGDCGDPTSYIRNPKTAGSLFGGYSPTTLILGGWVLVEILLLFAGMVGSRYIQEIVVYPPASSSSNSDCRLKSDC